MCFCVSKNKIEPRKQKFFIDDWLSEPVFKVWLVKDKHSTRARCSVCHKTKHLSSSDCAALTDHAKREKHDDAIKNISIFFDLINVRKKIKAIIIKSINSGYVCYKIRHFKTKIIWILKSVMNGLSFRANDEVKHTFASMFPGSKNTNSFSMARTKTMYVINKGLAPYFKSML